MLSLAVVLGLVGMTPSPAPAPTPQTKVEVEQAEVKYREVRRCRREKITGEMAGRKVCVTKRVPIEAETKK